MKHLLSVLVLLGVTSVARADEQYLLFTSITNLPSTIVGWKEYLENRYESQRVEYQSEIKNQAYDVGFLVQIDSPKIALTYWLGIGKDYKRELPIKLRISDLSVLQEMGLLEPKTKYPVPSETPICDAQGCKTKFKGPCYDFGCDAAFVVTREGSIESIQWDFAFD